MWFVILSGFMAGAGSALSGFTPRTGFRAMRSTLGRERGITL